jgi:hypothetical protein
LKTNGSTSLGVGSNANKKAVKEELKKTGISKVTAAKLN